MLPVLILVPLVGLFLLYQIERSYFWEELTTELAFQGELIARFAGSNWHSWQDPDANRHIWETLHMSIPSSIILLDRDGTVLSSSDPMSQALIDLKPDLPLIRATIQAGKIQYVQNETPVGPRALTVLVPIQDENGQVVGVVRIAHRVADLQEQLWSLRWSILTTLLAGGALSLVLGLLLARSLSLPLVRLTNAVACLRLGEEPVTVVEQGPDEIRALAQTYNVMGQRLYALESSRRQLLAGVVHELARPMGGIKAAAQTICRSDGRDLTVEMATGISQAVDQLQFQLEDLALLGQIEVQALKLEQEPVDLVAVVESQVDQFRWQAEQKKIDLDCRVEATPLIVQGDRRRLGQIVGNLLHNSIKYTPTGGQVGVAIRAVYSTGKPTALVQVTDTGPGIAPEEQQTIFDFFYRSPKQRRIHQGLGIGLALSRWLAEAHNGTLTVQSQPGRGATFTLSLPAVENLVASGTSPTV
jgi:signal transduction histidine kinase